jgi:hypothetical protein
LAILDSVRLVSGCTETRFPVCFIFGIIPIKPDDLAVPLKGKDMSGDPVKKPSVVAYHDSAAGKVFKSLLKSS